MNKPTSVETGLDGRCTTATIDLAVAGASQSTAAIHTDFTFQPSDPYAVSVVFRVEGQTIVWTFGRELLVRGLHEPVGLGDVQLWPSLDLDGNAVVVIELSSPEGTVLLQAPSRELTAFVHAMLSNVPLGSESQFVDVDAELAALLV